MAEEWGELIFINWANWHLGWHLVHSTRIFGLSMPLWFESLNYKGPVIIYGRGGGGKIRGGHM